MVACGTSSQPAAEQVCSDGISSSSNGQALSTTPPEGSSSASVNATPPSLPVPEPTQSLRTPTPDPANGAEEQVGLDPDVDPPDLLSPKTGRRIIKFSQPDGYGTKERTLEIHSILPRDAIPEIDNPLFITAKEASQNLVDRDLVIGLSFNGEHKAYSTAFLSSREVVNDVIGGKPVAVTWLPLCFTGIVYAREVAGMELTFGVSGKLIMNALVMYDRQTETLWSQFLGQAMEGELAGETLGIMASQLVMWSTWKEEHPDTLVLDTGGGVYDQYNSY